MQLLEAETATVGGDVVDAMSRRASVLAVLGTQAAMGWGLNAAGFWTEGTPFVTPSCARDPDEDEDEEDEDEFDTFEDDDEDDFEDDDEFDDDEFDDEDGDDAGDDSDEEEDEEF